MVRLYSVRADLAPVLADPVGRAAARRARVGRVQVARARVPLGQVVLARVLRPVVRREAHLVPVARVRVALAQVPVVQADPVGRLAQVPVVPEVLRAAEPWATVVSR